MTAEVKPPRDFSALVAVPRVLRRYLVFAYTVKRGGWDDYQGSHDTQVAAEAMATYLTEGEAGYARSHVVDLETHEVVSRHIWRSA